MHNRPSWKEVLSAIARSFKEKREEVEGQARGLTQHVAEANPFGIGQGGGVFGRSTQEPELFNRETLRQVYENLMKTADREQGGFGHAPKFPQTFSIQFLLHYYHFTRTNRR